MGASQSSPDDDEYYGGADREGRPFRSRGISSNPLASCMGDPRSRAEREQERRERYDDMFSPGPSGRMRMDHAGGVMSEMEERGGGRRGGIEVDGRDYETEIEGGAGGRRARSRAERAAGSGRSRTSPADSAKTSDGLPPHPDDVARKKRRGTDGVLISFNTRGPIKSLRCNGAPTAFIPHQQSVYLFIPDLLLDMRARHIRV